MIKKASLLFAVLTLSGCATSGPDAMLRGSYYGVSYSTVGEAEQVLANARATALSEVIPLPSPLIEKTLVIAIPSFTSVSKYRDTVDPPAWNKLAQYARDFFDRDFIFALQNTAAAIQKRNLYKKVEIIEGQTNATEPVPTSGKDHLYWKFNPTAWGVQMYFSSEKSGQVTLSGDSSSASPGAAMKSLINNLSALAMSR